MPPVLVVVGGLPATGKSTIARLLAEQIKAPYLRVDRIEQAIVAWSELSHPLGPTGYAVAYELAREQLQLGLDVIVECVNPISLTRDSWVRTATEAGGAILEVEVVCSDEGEHRRRVESRTPDIEGLLMPTWTVVMEREYQPWTRKHLVVDSAKMSAAHAAQRIASKIKSVTEERALGNAVSTAQKQNRGLEHEMAQEQLRGRRVAILAADGVERVELEQPRDALRQAGVRTDLLSVHDGQIQARNHDLEPAGTFEVDGLIADAAVEDYDALVLPGGTVNPDKLRLDNEAVAFVRDFVNSGRPVAAICHGPWTLVEAGVVSDRTLTSYPSIRTDLRNAGANVVDEEVARDGNLLTSRSPRDLPAFCAAVIEAVARSDEPTSSVAGA